MRSINAMKVILLLFIVLLHGCAIFPPFHSQTDLIQQVDRYLNEHEYSKALSLIAATSDNNPHAAALATKRKMILKQVEIFEHKTVSTAIKQERSNNWPGAKNTYKEAIKKINNSKLLEKERESMLKRFQSRMLALEQEKLVITGEGLKKLLPLQRSLHENDPKDIALQWTYTNIQYEAKETAQKLLEAGNQELAENNLAMAQRLLPLSVTLNPTPENKAAAEQLQKKLAKRNKKKQKNRSEIQRKKNKQAIDEFNKAMALGELTEARNQLARLPSSVRKQPLVELMQERLDKAITTRVEEEISMGESFYRAGEYKQALTIWQDILKLVPEHKTVQIKNDRTQKVILKIKALQEQQKSIQE